VTAGTNGEAPSDPKALRALAHPIRWKLIDILAAEGNATVTRCAAVLGESTATCSYHLGILGKYGYITRVAGQRGRDKPWQLVSNDVELSSSGLDPEGVAASRAAAGALLDYELAWLKESLRHADREPGQWQHTNKVISTTTWVTAREAKQITAEIRETLDKYANRGTQPAERPEGAREVRLFAAVAVAPPAPLEDK
jgi:hypothetical protein